MPKAGKPQPLRVIARFHRGINDGGEVGLFARRKIDPPELLCVAGNPGAIRGQRVAYQYRLDTFVVNSEGVKVAEYRLTGFEYTNAQ